MKEISLQVSGLKTAYLKYGKGLKPVFLLHGWGGSKESWQPLMAELEAKTSPAPTLGQTFCFILVDLPGFGKTEEPPTGWDVSNYAQWFEHFITQVYQVEELRGNYDVIVHSFGGRILLKLFAENFKHSLTERPNKLVLVAAAGIKPTKTLRLKIAAGAAHFGKSILYLPILNRFAPLAQRILYKALRTHDYEKTSGVMRDTFLQVIKEDLVDCLNKIKCPTLIIWGKQDTYVPVKDAMLMHSKITDSELQIIKEGRHGIHKTHTKLVAGWVKEFLNK